MGNGWLIGFTKKVNKCLVYGGEILKHYFWELEQIIKKWTLLLNQIIVHLKQTQEPILWCGPDF